MENKTYSLPLSGWRVTSKKTKSLNMNEYRNMHYQTNNKLKKMVSEYLMQYKFERYNRIKIHYKVYFKDKRNRDIMNYVSVADKFILDHLVNIGSIPDDNYKHVTGYTIDFAGIGNNNLIEFTIIDLDNNKI